VRKRQPIEYVLFELGVSNLGESEKRIADLLSLAGLITDSNKLSVLETALVNNQPITKALLESGLVSDNSLVKALNLQQHVRAGTVSLTQAGEFLKKSQYEGKDLEKLLSEVQAKGDKVNQLEQSLGLLLKSGLLSKEDVSAAEQIAQAEGKHLGEVLLSQNKVTLPSLEAVWQTQRMVDDRVISFDYACSALSRLTDQSKELQLANQEILPPSEIDPSKPSASKAWVNKLVGKLFNK